MERSPGLRLSWRTANRALASPDPRRHFEAHHVVMSDLPLSGSSSASMKASLEGDQSLLSMRLPDSSPSDKPAKASSKAKSSSRSASYSRASRGSSSTSSSRAQRREDQGQTPQTLGVSPSPSSHPAQMTPLQLDLTPAPFSPMVPIDTSGLWGSASTRPPGNVAEATFTPMAAGNPTCSLWGGAAGFI